MSDANRTLVSYVREATPGTTPPTPAFKPLRITTDGLIFRPTTVRSNELVNSRRVRDMVRVGHEVGGSLGFEFLYGNLDDLLESILFNLWIPTTVRYNVTADSEITDVAAATGVVTVATNASDNTRNSGAFAVAHLVRTTGFTNAGNNYLKRVTAASATNYTVAIAGLVNETAPPAGARAKVVGIEAPAVGNISATTSGLGAGETGIINGTGVDFLALGIVPGVLFKASEFTGTTANNGWYRPLNVTATRIGCDIVPSGFATDAAGSAQVRLWLSDYIRDGVTKQSVTLEEQFQDLALPEFSYFKGQYPETLDVEFTPQQILTSTLGWMGLNATNATSRFAGATDATTDINGALPRSGDILSASANVAAILLDGTAFADAVAVTRFSLQINNSLRRRPAVGVMGAASIGAGRCLVTGAALTYYGNNSIRTKLLAGTAAGITARLHDPNGTRAIIIDVPRLKFTDGSVDGIQVDSDRVLNAQYEGLERTGFSYVLNYQRCEEFA